MSTEPRDCYARREPMFLVTTLVDDARESDEPLGTKRKFWLHIGDRPSLFKVGRPGTGEN
uniref:Uncharacterized protein n=1 Tax=Candidatus Kentrum sp. FM TaxID=2126340 RepID=A0A450S291_9GAMM|nr:MAG: hypothetical protein BECKFM1743A_GA0114220_100214 [Candidatus Kentron sp. FM]VFJ45769.1 MAG: hypothetical protein BECKFM1743C_GA0114222_100304 [Candidatus Kentron sp. FM]VFK07007.1 MAG: hypothetical protein BECKFM1743B_GA0114221_1002910 [Candidatus Kentron sp. FM]